MHDHQHDTALDKHVANLLGVDLSAIVIHFECGDPEQRWIDSIAAESQREYEEHERDLDTADRLGMRPVDDYDERHGNVAAVCEGCHEDWPHGLEVIGGAALCEWCIDALDGSEVHHAG